jgi:hypothetical protein
MRLPGWIRVLGKHFWAILFPIGEIRHHMKTLVRKSAQELGMQPEVIWGMEVLAEETCQEIGLPVIIEENF